MSFHFVPLVIPIFASAVLSLGMAWYGLTHRRTRGAQDLAVCSLIVALWAVSNALEHSGSDLETMLFWANVQYLANGFSPLSWFTLVFRFNGKEKYVTPRNIVLFSIVPAMTAILVWFDPTLGLVRHSFALRFDGTIPYIEKVFGPWFWFHYAYVYAIHLTGLAFLIAAVGKKGSIFRRQSLYLLVSISMVNLANLSYVLGFSPVKHWDLTPIVFSFSALVLGWGIFHHHIFTIPPIARTRVFERMAAGLLVVDGRWNLIDSNEAARRMLGLGDDHIGKSLRVSLPSLARVTGPLLFAEEEGDSGFLRTEMVVDDPHGDRHVELNSSRLIDRQHANAWAIIATDITDLKRAREQIIRQREALATAAERDRLSMELHDTLGQVLSFAVIQSDTVLREIGRSNYTLAASYISRQREILKATHEDLRSFVRGLRTTDLEGGSFHSILAREADRLGRDSGAAVVLRVSPEGADLPAFSKNHLAGIVREALNNVAKHARASKVAIGFEALPGGGRLVIEDDGVGLPPDGGAGRGSGLGILRERTKSLRGRLSLEPAEGGGTRLVVTFPAESP